MKRSAIALTLLWLTSFPTLADEAYDQCVAGGKPHNECGEAWVQRENTAMLAAWNNVHGQTDGNVEAVMATEQTAWEAFSQTACAFMLDENFAPEGDRTSYLKCRAGVIAERTRTIETYTKYVDN